MKREAWAFWGLVLLALSLRSLAFLQQLSPAPTPRPAPRTLPPRPRPTPRSTPGTLPLPLPTPEPTPPSETYARHVGALRRFAETETPWAFTVTYGFIDHNARPQEVTCDVSKSAYEWEVEHYGFDEADLNRQLDERLDAEATKELAARRLEGSLHLVFGQGGVWEATPILSPGLDPVDRAEKLRAIHDFYAYLRGDFEKSSLRIRRALYAEHGVRLAGNTLAPDYAALATRASRPLADCFRALDRAGSGDSERRRLGLFLAFLQEIPYEVPPDRWHGRRTLGLFVPTEVVVGHHGDCDSKSVTFAALWRNFDTPLILISLPRHMLVGVAVTPGPGEHFVQVGNRYFVLCEVVGPGKPHPGYGPIPDSFEYVLVEPLAGGRS